jgi:hypothetical protein
MPYSITSECCLEGGDYSFNNDITGLNYNSYAITTNSVTPSSPLSVWSGQSGNTNE